MSVIRTVTSREIPDSFYSIRRLEDAVDVDRAETDLDQQGADDDQPPVHGFLSCHKRSSFVWEKNWEKIARR